MKFYEGKSGQAMSAGLGALDDVFNPAAARAKESLKADHERVVRTPSPGDDLLRSGRLTIVMPGDDEAPHE